MYRTGPCHGTYIEHAVRAEARHASCRCDGILPLCGSFCPEDPQCGSGHEVALQVEGVVNRSVHAEEALGRSRRLDALQLALASSHCLMRVLRAIVIPQRLLMRTGKPETSERRGVGAQLAGDQQFRRKTLLLEQLAHQPQRRPGVAPALNQHVKDLALVVDGAPQIHPLAGDPLALDAHPFNHPEPRWSETSEPFSSTPHGSQTGAGSRRARPRPVHDWRDGMRNIGRFGSGSPFAPDAMIQPRSPRNSSGAWPASQWWNTERAGLPPS